MEPPIINEFVRTWGPVFGRDMEGGFRAFILRYHPDRAPPQQKNDANRITQIINGVHLLLRKISERQILTGSDLREMPQLIRQKREFDELKAKLDAYIKTPERNMREDITRREGEEYRRREAEEARRRAELERIRRETQQARERARVEEERLRREAEERRQEEARREAEERRQEEARREAEEIRRRWREEFGEREPPPPPPREEEPAEEPFTVPKEQMSFEDYERELAKQETERRKKLEKEEEASKRARERYGFILRIESDPSGAQFELRDNTRAIAQNKTPFEINLPRGTYIVEILNYTYVGRKSYFFTRWENDDTQKRRVIQLNSNITIKAGYEIPRSPIPHGREEKARRQLTEARLLGPFTSVEEARKKEEPPKKVEITGFPTGVFPGGRPTESGEGEGRPPGDRGREEREGPEGEIKGKVVDSQTNKPLEEVQVQAFAAPQGFYDQATTDDKGIFSLWVPSGKGYRLQASKSGYKTRLTRSPLVEPGPRGENEFNPEIKLDSEKPEKGLFKGWGKGKSKIQKGYPLFTIRGLKDNLLRILIAAIITGTLFFVLYKPLFDALGFDNPLLSIILPIVGFFIIFFFLPLKKDEEPKWGALTLAIILAIATWIGLWLAPTFDPAAGFLRARYFLWGIPLAVFLITWKMAQGEKGMGKTLVTVGGVLLLVGFIVMFAILARGGKLTQIDTYLKTLDVLKLVGVSEDTVEGMKSGVRNTLSFLQFKGAQPTKPEAKKIGGFEAIQLKFGSKHNNYLLPTLFARMDYVLPVTVTNPNKFDTKLVVEDFKIENVFLNNKSNERIICGTVGEDPDKITGLIDLGNINPEEEKITTIDFKGKSTANNQLSGEKIDCRVALGEYKDPDPTNPMFPAKVKVKVDEKNKSRLCKDSSPPLLSGDTDFACVDALHKFYRKYSISATPSSGDVSARYIDSEGMCECKINRYFNNMDDLCFLDNDKARIELRSNYGFKVQGKGELILVKADTDKKLSPKPTITSSAGPLTVTVYFVPDVNVIETGKTQTSRIFVDVKNEGDGNADLIDMSLNFNLLEGLILEKSKCLPLPQKEDKSQQVRSLKVPVSKEGTTISCPVTVKGNEVNPKITGSYLTIPVIVDFEYRYSQTHSATLNVKKEIIPDDLDSEQERELNRGFYGLPYYCPNKEIKDPIDDSFNVVPLKIFDIEKPCDQMADAECQQNSGRCDFAPPVGVQTKGTCNPKQP